MKHYIIVKLNINEKEINLEYHIYHAQISHFLSSYSRGQISSRYPLWRIGYAAKQDLANDKSSLISWASRPKSLIDTLLFTYNLFPVSLNQLQRLGKEQRPPDETPFIS